MVGHSHRVPAGGGVGRVRIVAPRMADGALVEAVWAGPFTAEMHGIVGDVRIGDTVELPEANLASSHWRRVEKPGVKANPVVVAVDEKKADG